MSEILMIPLARLYVHPLNSRSEPPPAEIELLAESIRETGLLQNLMGFRDPTHDPLFANPNDLQSWTCGIVAGGRRLRALQLLHGPAGGQIDVPVLVTADPAIAAEWSGTENTARAALNPADEVRAYHRMRQQGASYARIATAFAVTERKVMGRLKLATLSDPVLDALRAGQISIDQAEALTVAPNDAAAEALLPNVISNNGNHFAQWTADRIRRELRGSAVPLTDRRAILVGIDTYADRGGRIQSDLFSDSQVLLDAALLDTLFAEALEAARAAVLSEGWAEVYAFDAAYPDHELIHQRSGTRIRPIPVVLPEADAAELAELQERAENNELPEADLERMHELEEREAGDYDDEQRAAATAYIYVNNRGEIGLVSAHLPKQQAEGTGTDGGTIEVKAEAIPQNLRDDLNIIRTLGLQTALLEKPELMLDLLCLTLTAEVSPWQRPLALSPTAQNITPSKAEETTISIILADAIPSANAHNQLTLEHLDTLRTVGKKARNAAITAALARCMHTAASDFGKALASRLGVDYRQVWHPSAENYFKRLPGGMLDRIWDDLVEDRPEVTEAFRAKKKAEKAKDLHQLFHSDDFREALGLSRAQNARIDQWLPPELRLPAADAAQIEDAA